MDVNNQLLKELLHKTDIAFEALRADPASEELQMAYDEAKQALDNYVTSAKEHLMFRQRQR
ncbi:MAG TPA: hypothetical protein DEH24_10905 [Alteromonas sp.]|jgi:hypothetical protein|nr:hypothetical protein [Alteromonadaceae bacterium]MAX41657.1 hypothetical protein [Alteromonadaceae bacterium]MBL52502.1 hypothetical protein [Alteromonadaceae bacterium]HBY39919.1 hypothetical protein [Alteromonas sp.]|tara:strand:- start:782 stop:964 length:183 start_codon:yes stop_codon:yes gene_type:complete